jgi:GT2 family glycosyltransferase
MEWDTPTGDARACGGDAMMRVEAFEAVGGFSNFIVAGEEPDLCFRMREKRWKIWRYEEEMTRHDAAMANFYQWWNRAVRPRRKTGLPLSPTALNHRVYQQFHRRQHGTV